jgi:hypothetical protein
LEIKLKIDIKSFGKILIGIFVGLAMFNLVQNNPFLEDFQRRVGFAILSMILTVVILSLIKD